MAAEAPRRRILRPEIVFGLVLVAVLVFGAVGTQAFPDDPDADAKGRVYRVSFNGL